MKKDFLKLQDLNSEQLLNLLDLAIKIKAEVNSGIFEPRLKNKTLAMIFEKPSTRTRVSFEVAMLQLGGASVVLDQKSSQLGRGETYADTARVLASYCDAIMCRTADQSILEELAKYSKVPVINGLSDQFHPVQLLADLLTARENNLNLATMKVCYLGDFNNMTSSWINAAHLLGFHLNIACPHIESISKKSENVIYYDSAQEAVKDSNIIYTDTWVSMNVNGEKNADIRQYQPYQVNADLLSLAPEAIVMHCLPAHRGDEITDEVMDGSQSRVFEQAENRLHAQKALLFELLL